MVIEIPNAASSIDALTRQLQMEDRIVRGQYA